MASVIDRKQSKLLTGQQFAFVDLFRITENSKKNTKLYLYKVSGYKNRYMHLTSKKHSNAYVDCRSKIKRHKIIIFVVAKYHFVIKILTFKKNEGLKILNTYDFLFESVERLSGK